MKYSNILIGFVLFSAITYLFLDISNSMAGEYGNENEEDLADLRGEYNFIGEFSYDEGETLRDIDEATETGEQEKDVDTNFLTGAIQGSKLIGGSFTSVYRVIKQIAADLNIHPIFLSTIIAIFSILSILFVLYMLARFKAET